MANKLLDKVIPFFEQSVKDFFKDPVNLTGIATQITGGVITWLFTTQGGLMVIGVGLAIMLVKVAYKKYISKKQQ